MLKKLSLVLLVIFFFKQRVEANSCFVDHLKDAIKLNLERKDQYSTLSDGDSLKVSWYLIFSEIISLPVAFGYDLWAEKYEKSGVSVSCNNFISMNKVKPLVQAPIEPDVDVKKFSSEIQIDFLVGASAKFIENLEYNKLATLIRSELDKIPIQNYNCMTRHILESAYLVAIRSRGLIQEAKDKGLSSPASGLNFLLGQHLNRVVLWGAKFTDRLAFDSQRKGVPILCSDVPDIRVEIQ